MVNFLTNKFAIIKCAIEVLTCGLFTLTMVHVWGISSLMDSPFVQASFENYNSSSAFGFPENAESAIRNRMEYFAGRDQFLLYLLAKIRCVLLGEN
ncbi:hypothetical protein T05_1614 [Trichinella murrelli]|uniref:Uncharacterized protein n=1 Tax=Trichinella murrelli TaxID=144512 RepID=A0A0V0TLA6_9BILA|nr:hypothetical protein T05_1614 [Trichinella murrelli]